MTKEKYALLDTDFISKTHLIRKDDQNKMIDRIMEMQGYQFFCHEQIRIELKRHNHISSFAGASLGQPLEESAPASRLNN